MVMAGAPAIHVFAVASILKAPVPGTRPSRTRH
jgi:hypothetical protein